MVSIHIHKKSHYVFLGYLSNSGLLLEITKALLSGEKPDHAGPTAFRKILAIWPGTLLHSQSSLTCYILL